MSFLNLFRSVLNATGREERTEIFTSPPSQGLNDQRLGVPPPPPGRRHGRDLPADTFHVDRMGRWRHASCAYQRLAPPPPSTNDTYVADGAAFGADPRRACGDATRTRGPIRGAERGVSRRLQGEVRKIKLWCEAPSACARSCVKLADGRTVGATMLLEEGRVLAAPSQVRFGGGIIAPSLMLRNKRKSAVRCCGKRGRFVLFPRSCD